jgi:hypothetical protein
MTYPVTPGYVEGCDTSKAAAKITEPGAGTVRGWVYQEIKKAGKRGRTCEEIERRLHLRHQSASARIRELVLFGNIEIVGMRENDSGVRARVYVAVER